VANIQTLANRLRAEIGDIGRFFDENFTGDGRTRRFQLSVSPVKGLSLKVLVNGVDVSATTAVEEVSGLFELANVAADNATIEVSGTQYKYFTDVEIQQYVINAFYEHAYTTTDSNGSLATMASLPVIDEYPLVILATSMALYTLATDAAFDIDIISPDGVSIPRSERYRQLMEVVQQRKEQYRELCSLLGIGMYRIEVTTLRRISRRTNRYVPVYRPQEVDDGSIPQRVYLSMPTYGDITPPSSVPTKDLSMYSGDDFCLDLAFDHDLTHYTALSQIRLYPQLPANQVGPLLLATFEITKSASISGGILDKLSLYLPSSVTADLPRTAYWDLQLTDNTTGHVKTYLQGKIFTKAQVTTTNGDFHV
jgi:hypothetical protein